MEVCSPRNSPNSLHGRVFTWYPLRLPPWLFFRLVFFRMMEIRGGLCNLKITIYSTGVINVGVPILCRVGSGSSIQ